MKTKENPLVISGKYEEKLIMVQRQAQTLLLFYLCLTQQYKLEFLKFILVKKEVREWGKKNYHYKNVKNDYFFNLIGKDL